MSAQRRSRAPSSGTRNQSQDQLTQKSARSGQRRQESDADWAERHGELGGQPASRVGSPIANARDTDRTMPRTNAQGGSRWNQQQDPEHPERSADGGEAEMRSGASSARSPGEPNSSEPSEQDRRSERQREES